MIRLDEIINVLSWHGQNKKTTENNCSNKQHQIMISFVLGLETKPIAIILRIKSFALLQMNIAM